MKKSKSGNLELSDVVNVIKHMVYVFISTVLAAIMNGAQNQTPIDLNVLGVGAVIGLVTGLQVLVDRYLRDNTK